MQTPADLRYTKDHEWVRLESDGTVTMGITDFAQGSLGDIVYVELPGAGTAVSHGSRCGSVESTKSVSDLYAAVSGEVVAKNDALDAQPELVNQDAYGQGWMLRVKPAGADLSHLMDATAYAAHVDAAGH
jgi:glycine cleavage system H protein